MRELIGNILEEIEKANEDGRRMREVVRVENRDEKKNKLKKKER